MDDVVFDSIKILDINVRKWRNWQLYAYNKCLESYGIRWIYFLFILLWAGCRNLQCAILFHDVIVWANDNDILSRHQICTSVNFKSDILCINIYGKLPAGNIKFHPPNTHKLVLVSLLLNETHLHFTNFYKQILYTL